jgi:hypothetical protein
MVARNSTSPSASSSLLVASASPRTQQLQRNAAVSAARAAALKVVPFCRFSSSSSSYYGRSSSQRSLGTEASVGSTETANSNSNNKGKSVLYPKRDVAAIQPRRRRVRFDFDENTDAVRSTVHVYPKVSGESERALCWNSKHDIQRMKKELHQETIDFVKTNPDYIGCLEKLFNSPLSRHPSIAAARSNSSNSSSSSTEFDAAQFVTRVMAHESAPRGLEYRMSFLIHRHKQWTSSTVLQRQAQLRREAAIGSDRTSSLCSASVSSAAHHRHWQVSEALARCCQHLSRCTAELAVQYARADALQAQQVYGDAFLTLCPM